MGAVPAEERPKVGALVNTIRAEIEEVLACRFAELKASGLERKLREERIDVTLPAPAKKIGKLHPITQTRNRMVEIFTGMGFEIAEGPEVESSYYNFDALNAPADHPSRDATDTFYFSENVLLRTQTSPVQIRSMIGKQPPIRMICPGRVFRSDDVDATHSPVFHQIEGLVIDKGITFADLKGTLNTLVEELYGKGTKMPMGILTRLCQTADPDNSKVNVPWVNLSDSNVLATDKTELPLFMDLVKFSGAAKGKYSRGAKFWAMNETTHTTLMANSLGVNAAAAISAGMNNTMPVVGGTIEELSFMPDGVIVGGYGDLYLLVEREGGSVAQSEHARFVEDQTVFKGTARYDGAPVIAEGFVAIGINGAKPTADAVTFAEDKANAAAG